MSDDVIKPSPQVERLAEFFGAPVAVQLSRPVVLVTLSGGAGIPVADGRKVALPKAEMSDSDVIATDILVPAIIQPEHTGTGIKVMYEVKDHNGDLLGVAELIVPADLVVGVTILWDARKEKAQNVVLTKTKEPKIILP